MDSYSYDAAGNLLNDGTHSYTYDAENHIIKVDGGSTATYTYDADGRRVETINSEGTMDKIYDRSDNVIADWLATGQMQGGWDVGYVYLGGRLAAVYEGSTTYFVGVDHLGSTRAMSDTSGNIVDAHDYLPFGEQLEGGTYTTHKFTGFERDSETGLDNARARYHASWMGRFLSPDPHNAGAIATSPQTWNAYVYVSNNPLTLTDPTGMMAEENDPDQGGHSVDYNRDVGGQQPPREEDTPAQTGQQSPPPTSEEGSEANLDKRNAIASNAEDAYSRAISTQHDPYGPDECSTFVADQVNKAGANATVQPEKGGPRPPVAGEWASKDKNAVPGWRPLGPNEKPAPGDVAAYALPHPRPGATGDSAIVVSNGKGGLTAVHAGEHGILHDSHFIRDNATGSYSGVVYRRYTGG